MEIKDVEKLAELVKIELSEEEKKTILKDMDGILAYVKAIEEVDVGNVTAQYGLHNVWREDLPAVAGEEKSFSSDLIIKQFPDAQPARPHDSSGAGGDGIFLKVKKIL